MRELQAAEQAVDDALLTLEVARQHLAVVIRRESRQERTKASRHLRLIGGASQ
jgi:hypothetical protein